MPLIIPANTISGGYEVANSLRFDDGSTDYLNGSGGAGATKTKFTFSVWVKRSNLASVDDVLLGKWSSGNDRGHINFSDTPNDTIQLFEKVSGSTTTHLLTNRLFRDVSAWYHIVYIGDTTQATASNRLKLYINGVQETSFATATYPSQNSNWQLQALTQDFGIGAFASTNAGASPFSGYMAEIVYLDGIAGSIGDFGEFDEDSGIWKPINVSGLTFGTNGFYLDFENSGSLGADVSGNGNNFTVNNLTAIDQSTDTCTNNFCTMNPLATNSNTSLSEGNLVLQSSYGTDNTSSYGTIGVNQGKWYWEIKYTTGTLATSARVAGVIHVDSFTFVNGERASTGGNDGIALMQDGSTENDGTTTSAGSYMSALSTGDIIGVALDADNGQIKFNKNGGSFGSDLTFATNNNGYHVAIDMRTSSGTSKVEANFGNPTYSISSGNSDGNGYGNFEYAPPSGYYSLNSKNLAEYG